MKINDAELTIPPLSPVCAFCAHLHAGTWRSCDAYPDKDSIPSVIWLGENDHRAPYAGDRGIRFEPQDDWTVKAKADDDAGALLDSEFESARKLGREARKR